MIRYRPIAGAALTALALALAVAGAALAGDGGDCPPNPEPGKCYEKVFIPRRSGGAIFEWRVVPCYDGRQAPSRAYSPTSPPPYGGGSGDIRVLTSPNLVRAVQLALLREGYHRGPSDGVASGPTERGLARFQADRRLAPGWTKETLRALGVPYPWGSPD
jgi:hypothetical protein